MDQQLLAMQPPSQSITCSIKDQPQQLFASTSVIIGFIFTRFDTGTLDNSLSPLFPVLLTALTILSGL